jgi:hypothetical protein
MVLADRLPLLLSSLALLVSLTTLFVNNPASVGEHIERKASTRRQLKSMMISIPEEVEDDARIRRTEAETYR